MLNLELKSVKELKELQFQVSEALARRRLQRVVEASREFVNTVRGQNVKWTQENTKASTVEQSRDILIKMSRNYTTVHNLPMFIHYLEVLELVLDLDDE